MFSAASSFGFVLMQPHFAPKVLTLVSIVWVNEKYFLRCNIVHDLAIIYSSQPRPLNNYHFLQKTKIFFIDFHF